MKYIYRFFKQPRKLLCDLSFQFSIGNEHEFDFSLDSMPFEFPLSQFRRQQQQQQQQHRGREREGMVCRKETLQTLKLSRIAMQRARCVCAMRWLCFQIAWFCRHANVIECRKQGDMICALKELPFISISLYARHSQDTKHMLKCVMSSESKLWCCYILIGTQKKLCKSERNAGAH